MIPSISGGSKLWVNRTPQHLYIVSDEKISISDWCIDNSVITLFNSKRSENSKKIIATTDKSLNLPLIHDSFLSPFMHSCNAERQITEVDLEMVDPIVTTNQGLGYNESITSTINRIVGDDVYLNPVENNYDVNFDIPFSKSCLEEIEKQELNLRVKTRQDNTVIIHQSKTYTQNEVKTLVEKAWNNGYWNRYEEVEGKGKSFEDALSVMNFIKEKLQLFGRMFRTHP